MAEGDSSLSQQLLARSTSLVVLESALMILINVAALLGNLLVCLAVYRSKRLQTIPNMYVVMLAISDALMAALAMPMACVFLITGRWMFSDEVCQFQGFLTFFFALVSVLTMTATAVNRFFHIVKPNFYRSHVNFRITLLSLAAITIFGALGAGLSSVVGWARFLEHHGKVFCFMEFESKTVEKFYIGVLDIFYILIPMGVIYWCYFRIFRLVRAHKQETFASASSTGNRRFNVEEVKITKVLFAIVLAFTICWSPIALMDFIDVVSTHSVFIPRQVFLLYIYLGYGSCSINPFIYGIMNRTFRAEFFRIFRLCRKNNATSPSSEMNTVHSLRISVVSKADEPKKQTGESSTNER